MTKERIIKLCVFAIYWLFTLISIIIDFSGWTLFFNLIVFLPITICMTFDFDVPSLFILIIYFAFMIILSLIGTISGIVNNTFAWYSYILMFIEMVCMVGALFLAIHILRNKPRIANLYIIIVTAIYCLAMVADMIIDVARGTKFDFFLFSSNILLYVLICLYFVFRKDKEIQIFK